MIDQKELRESRSTHPQFGPPKSAIREFLEQALITVIMALFLMTFIAQAVAVPTGSMQNTINIGDHLFVNKFIFGKPTPVLGKLLPTREIKRGDIIVFKLPSDPKVNYVKRVIGLPGETVQVKGRRVIVNGKELPEERALVRLTGPQEPELPVVKVEPKPAGAWYRVYYDVERSDEFEINHRAAYGVNEPVKVPDGQYFVMGDSRDNSEDSRYWGFVPRENIFARALYVHLSFDPRAKGLINKLASIRWNRLGAAVK
ncbi:MAG: Signal peptidase I [Acidobacteria bacterium]|nr:Signal peptidase I [Acidobacteriota bacterium]